MYSFISLTPQKLIKNNVILYAFIKEEIIYLLLHRKSFIVFTIIPLDTIFTCETWIRWYISFV